MSAAVDELDCLEALEGLHAAAQQNNQEHASLTG